MDYDDLLAMLEIESKSEFSDFDAFSALMETVENLEFDDVNKLLNAADIDVLEELTSNYFEDISAALPDSETESGIFLQNMKQALIGKLQNSISEYADELFDFRKWYLFESEVEVVSHKGESEMMSFFEALFSYRAEKLARTEKSTYNFDDALDYELKEYTLNIKLDNSGDYREDASDEEMFEMDFLSDGYITEDISNSDYEYRRGMYEEHEDCCDCCDFEHE